MQARKEKVALVRRKKEGFEQNQIISQCFSCKEQECNLVPSSILTNITMAVITALII